MSILTSINISIAVSGQDMKTVMTKVTLLMEFIKTMNNDNSGDSDSKMTIDSVSMPNQDLSGFNASITPASMQNLSIQGSSNSIHNFSPVNIIFVGDRDINNNKLITALSARLETSSNINNPIVPDNNTTSTSMDKMSDSADICYNNINEVPMHLLGSTRYK